MFDANFNISPNQIWQSPITSPERAASKKRKGEHAGLDDRSRVKVKRRLFQNDEVETAITNVRADNLNYLIAKPEALNKIYEQLRTNGNLSNLKLANQREFSIEVDEAGRISNIKCGYLITTEQKAHLFVVDPKGDIYVGPYCEDAEGTINHVSFLAGGALISAGSLAIQDGKVVLIRNESNLYQTTLASLACGIQAFMAKGVNLNETLISFNPQALNVLVTVKEFLKSQTIDANIEDLDALKKEVLGTLFDD